MVSILKTENEYLGKKVLPLDFSFSWFQDNNICYFYFKKIDPCAWRVFNIIYFSHLDTHQNKKIMNCVHFQNSHSCKISPINMHCCCFFSSTASIIGQLISDQRYSLNKSNFAAIKGKKTKFFKSHFLRIAIIYRFIGKHPQHALCIYTWSGRCCIISSNGFNWCLKIWIFIFVKTTTGCKECGISMKNQIFCFACIYKHIMHAHT